MLVRNLSAVIVFVLTAGCCIAAAPVSVSKSEQNAWIRYVIPLPKSIAIPSKIELPKNAVKVTCNADDQVAVQAVKELSEIVNGGPDASFTLKLELGGADAESLKGLNNGDQGYRIFPEGENSLKLVSLTTRGLFYAALTLKSLMGAYASGDSVQMPLLTVTDWPDLEDRGLWGSDSEEHLKWMGSIKLNIDEQISAREVDESGRGHSAPKEGKEVIHIEGPLYGIKPVHVVLHLDQVMGRGMLEYYPDFQGYGGEGGAICYSQPEIVNVLADWIVDLGSYPNVSEVDVWMSENLHGKGGCKCEECVKTERSLLEIRTIIKAWRKAQEKLPNLGLRTLSSEETAKMNGKIIAELPKEVKFWYYHSQLTYDTDHRPMITDELEQYARAGRWIGVCPSLTQYCQPFTCADFPRYRMNEFVDKQLRGVLVYATPRTEFGYFNVEGEAEWAWNSKGRSAYEFSISYGIRHGYKDPELFAKWVELQSSVSWHVYASDWPNGEKKKQPGKVAKLLVERRMPDLGVPTYRAYGVPFAGIKNIAILNADFANAAKALTLAKQLGMPQYILESTVVQGYISSLKALYELKQLVKPEGITPSDQNKARKYFNMYIDSLQQSLDNLQPWEAVVSGVADSNITLAEREQLKEMQDGMKAAAKFLGIDLRK